MQDASRLASSSTGALWETRRPLLPPRRASTNSTVKSTSSNKPPLSAATNMNMNLPGSTPPPVALTRSKSSNSPGLLSARDFALMRPPSSHTPLCRTVGISMQRSQPDSALAAGPSARNAPFRRSHSKPENPTSNIGARAIEEASHEHARKNGKKLIFMRNFSVSEEDVVVCNRVRSGVNPAYLRQRNAQDRRYLRSLSVEESRLIATRRRSNLSSMAVPEHEQLETSSSQSPSRHETLPLADDDPFTMTIDPAPDARKSTASRSTTGHVLMSPRKLSSPRGRVEPVAPTTPTNSSSRTSNKCDVTASDSNTSTLTPREKAMHGRYLIRESFANGSYGKVCAGEALASHQEVAVKIVPKYVLISPEEKQSVIREQIIHKSLDHPHIIKLLDVFEDDGAHYFILERADNGALSTIISYSGLPESRCREVFKQLLLALEYLHRNNIVHHDVKPHNVLLKSGSGIKLCDFGASRAFSKTETSLPFAGVFGTPGYIAPELLMGDATYGPAIDMFSAGVLLFEMVFGYAPFYPPSSCTYMPLEFPRDANVSSQVKHLLSKLLAREPATRLTASQALGHPWITLATPGRSAPSSPVVSPRNLTTVTSMW